MDKTTDLRPLLVSLLVTNMFFSRYSYKNIGGSPDNRTFYPVDLLDNMVCCAYGAKDYVAGAMCWITVSILPHFLFFKGKGNKVYLCKVRGFVIKVATIEVELNAGNAYYLCLSVC